MKGLGSLEAETDMASLVALWDIAIPMAETLDTWSLVAEKSSGEQLELQEELVAQVRIDGMIQLYGIGKVEILADSLR